MTGPKVSSKPSSKPKSPGEIKELWRQTHYQLLHNGMNLDKVYKTVEAGLINRSIPLSFLGKLKKAGNALVDLNLNFVGKTVGMKGVKEMPYFSTAAKKYIEAATKPITSVQSLKAYASALPFYLKKAEAIDNHYGTDTGDERSKTVLKIKTIPGVVELIPLTEIELKLVHMMSLEKGVQWLKQNQLRTFDLSNAILDGAITDKQTYTKVRRDMAPKPARVEIKRLVGEHNKNKGKAA